MIGVQRQREARHEPAEPAEAAAHEVVHEHHARHPHQRLRHEHAQRVIAEHPHRQRLDPQRQRRLVHRHHPAAVERGEQEVVPARAHRAHRRAVVVVRPAVAAERPQVQHAGERRSAPSSSGRGRAHATARAPGPRQAQALPTGVATGATDVVAEAAERVSQEKLIGGASPPPVGAACERTSKLRKDLPRTDASVDQPSAQL